MKKFRVILCAALFCVFSVFASGCLLTQAQPMKNIQGTYKLTSYTRTDKKYESGDTIKTTVTDQIETYGYECYFVVTGNNRGYYACKTNEQSPYVKEVELQYEQGSEENQGKYAYVTYKDYTDTVYERMGVTKNHLTETQLATCFKLFGQPVTTPGFDKHWEKVAQATDLSYIQKQWGEIPTYTYEAWAKEGGYVVYRNFEASNLPLEEQFQDPYFYYYLMIDTWNMKATSYYADSTSKTSQQKTEDITLVDGWNTIQIGQDVWVMNEAIAAYERSGTAMEANAPYILSASKFVTENAEKEIRLQIEMMQEQVEDNAEQE